LPKFHQVQCEVCHHPVVDEKTLPAEIRSKIYRPKPDEKYNVEVNFERPGDGFGKKKEEGIEA